jgi:hypothetical protein
MFWFVASMVSAATFAAEVTIARCVLEQACFSRKSK